MCISRTDRVQYAQCDDDEQVLVLEGAKETDFPKRIFAKLRVGDTHTMIDFQLDSGSSVNILSEAVYQSAIGRRFKLRPPVSTLLMYNKTELK